MANFFSRIFGSKKMEVTSIEEVLLGVIKRGKLNLSVSVQPIESGFSVNFSGKDSNLLKEREGLLLDAFQIFIRRVLQNKFPDQKIDIEVDCEGFLEETAEELKDLTDKLKAHVLDKGAPLFVRPLPPRERKVVHRHLAEDGRFQSQSVGEGFCKKIKISLGGKSLE